MSFQFPFLYMHMLAFMVHLANFLTAIGTGITLGLLLARGRVEGEVSRDHISNTVTIGASLSYPIGSPGAKYMYRMPLDKMVAQLDKHLQMINLTSDSTKI